MIATDILRLVFQHVDLDKETMRLHLRYAHVSNSRIVATDGKTVIIVQHVISELSAEAGYAIRPLKKIPARAKTLWIQNPSIFQCEDKAVIPIDEYLEILTEQEAADEYRSFPNIDRVIASSFGEIKNLNIDPAKLARFRLPAKKGDDVDIGVQLTFGGNSTAPILVEGEIVGCAFKGTVMPRRL